MDALLEYSGELFGFIAAVATPLFNRLKALRNYQFGMPAIFNLFAYLLVVVACLAVWNMQPTTELYNNFPLYAVAGVLLVLISFFNGLNVKKNQAKPKHPTLLTAFSLTTYALGVGIIVFSINASSMLNNYYVFSGKLISTQQTVSVKKKQINLLIGGNQKSRLSTTTDNDGKYKFFLNRSQTCFLTRVEIDEGSHNKKASQMIELWPGLHETCINYSEDNPSAKAHRLTPQKIYQFQKDLTL